MLVPTFLRDKPYNPEDHLLIFLSLIYALAVNNIISSITDFIKYFSTDSLILYNNSMVFGWSLILLLLVAESWWGVWIDRFNFTSSFYVFVFTFFYPVLLCIVSGSLNNVLIKANVEYYDYREYYVFFIHNSNNFHVFVLVTTLL